MIGGADIVQTVLNITTFASVGLCIWLYITPSEIDQENED